ncbi:unnamed protein product [Laminaria digitata]
MGASPPKVLAGGDDLSAYYFTPSPVPASPCASASSSSPPPLYIDGWLIGGWVCGSLVSCMDDVWVKAGIARAGIQVVRLYVCLAVVYRTVQAAVDCLSYPSSLLVDPREGGVKKTLP